MGIGLCFLWEKGDSRMVLFLVVVALREGCRAGVVLFCLL